MPFDSSKYVLSEYGCGQNQMFGDELSDFLFNYIYIKDWLIHIIDEFKKKNH